MEMTDKVFIAAQPERVYEALNDPEILQQAIPDCDEFSKISDTEMTMKVTSKIGPIKTKFNFKVTLSDLNPPTSYSIYGEGQGGTAGFAKGGASVTLEPYENGTMMHYLVNVNIGGKLAQLGSRLIDGVAKKMAGQFFGTFGDIVGEPVEESAKITEVKVKSSPDNVRRWIWVGAAIVAASIFAYIQTTN